MSNFSSIDTQSVIWFAVLILPGFISMRVYSLIRLGDQPTLKDSLFEAAAYSTVNLGLMWWAIVLFLSTDSIWGRSILAALVFAIAPIAWPFLLDWVLENLAAKGWIKYRYKTAWDDFFSRRQACWLIVHMHDGSRLGGLFREKSYATLFPTPGHIFIQELWKIDQETGEFLGDGPASQGIILKPEDYRFLEIKAYIGEEGDVEYAK